MSDREVIENFGGLGLELMISSQSSNTTCCAFVETTPPGAGPPPHKHVREEEIFTVLKGEYEFYQDGAWNPMIACVLVLSYRNTYHAFRNIGQSTARILLMTNGGGIDDYFRSISRLRIPDGINLLREISSHYGYFYLPHSE